MVAALRPRRRPARRDNREPPRALTAAITLPGARSTKGRPVVMGTAQGRARPVDPRQAKVMDLWHAVPEMTFGTSFMATIISRIVPQVGAMTVEGVVEPAGDGGATLPPDVLAAARQALAELSVGDDGLAGFVKRAQFNIATTAEFWLAPPATPGEDPWTVHSVAEAHAEPRILMKDGTTRPGGALIEFDDGDTHFVRDAKRIWVPDPFRAWLAHGPLLVLIEVAEEIDLLVRETKAMAMSKLPNGILVIPSELQIVNELGQPLNFDEELDAALSTAIQDPGTVAALKPLIATCPGDLITKWQFVTFEKTQDDQIITRLENAVHRLARGMDLPAEYVTGMGTSTHWNAAEIGEDLYKSFVGPQGLWLHTRLWNRMVKPRVMEILGLADPDPYGPPRPMPAAVRSLAPWWDEGQLIAHPDRSHQAEVAYGTAWRPNFGISHVGYREMAGIPESFAPTNEEVLQRLAWAQHLAMRETLTGEAPAGDEMVPLVETAPGSE